jgi:hypothetical protein
VVPIFRAEWLEEFLLSYAHVSSVADVFGANRVKVGRTLGPLASAAGAPGAAAAAKPKLGGSVGASYGGPAGKQRNAHIKAYMLFRDGVMPDYKADLAEVLGDTGPKKDNRVSKRAGA